MLVIPQFVIGLDAIVTSNGETGEVTAIDGEYVVVNGKKHHCTQVLVDHLSGMRKQIQGWIDSGKVDVVKILQDHIDSQH